MIVQIWYTPKDNPTTRLLKIEGSEADMLGMRLALSMCDSKKYHSVHYDDMIANPKEVFSK